MKSKALETQFLVQLTDSQCIFIEFATFFKFLSSVFLLKKKIFIKFWFNVFFKNTLIPKHLSAISRQKKQLTNK